MNNDQKNTITTIFILIVDILRCGHCKELANKYNKLFIFSDNQAIVENNEKNPYLILIDPNDRKKIVLLINTNYQTLNETKIQSLINNIMKSDQMLKLGIKEEYTAQLTLIDKSIGVPMPLQLNVINQDITPYKGNYDDLFFKKMGLNDDKRLTKVGGNTKHLTRVGGNTKRLTRVGGNKKRLTRVSGKTIQVPLKSHKRKGKNLKLTVTK